MDIIHLNNFQDFSDIVSSETDVVFRGQVNDYSNLIPSCYRIKQAVDIQKLSLSAVDLYKDSYTIREAIKSAVILDEFIHTEMEKRAEKWLKMSEEDTEIIPGHPFYVEDYDDAIVLAWNLSGLSGFPTHSELSEEGGVDWGLSKQELQLALLQHYGIPTQALDVTYDPLVALWFAVHQFINVKERTGYYARVKSNSVGVIYSIETLENNITDLRPGKTLPVAGLRGQRQRGGLLIGATLKNQDLFGYVTRKIFVNPNIFLERISSTKRSLKLKL